MWTVFWKLQFWRSSGRGKGFQKIMAGPSEGLPSRWSGQELTKTRTDGILVQAHGMPVAFSHIAGRERGHLSSWLPHSMQQFPQGGGGCSSVGNRGDMAKIKPFLWVNLTSVLHSTSIPLPLFWAVHVVHVLNSVWSTSTCLCQMASCVFSPLLEYKLLKVHAAPPFTPKMPKQF